MEFLKEAFKHNNVIISDGAGDIGLEMTDVLHEKFREKLKSKMPLKRLLKPSDIAPTVLFLASEAAQFINGAVIPIEGGSRFVST
ncbi:MAG: SDR family oxidoreductase [Coxiellaceae bacterium]|nr:MAG: SDR family oxidoreductase [Coxiellaceae bacterium]